MFLFIIIKIDVITLNSMHLHLFVNCTQTIIMSCVGQSLECLQDHSIIKNCDIHWKIRILVKIIS